MRFLTPSLILLFTLLNFPGCTSPGKMIEVPKKPENQTSQVKIKIAPLETKLLDENVVLSRQHMISSGASVVISVPSEYAKRQSEYRRQRDGSEYSTDAFFNEAEQQIERSLIQHGFRVLSREKFEAKLRDMRDASINTSLKNDKNVGSRKIYEKTLNEKLLNEEISPDEYAKKLKDYDKATQTASTGSSEKGRQELTDISEVIRAAQTGDVQSDYILQINRFDKAQLVPYTVNLEHYDEYKKLIDQFPEVQQTLFEKRKQTCVSFEVSLNAKLIDVETGDIVWIGEHSINNASSNKNLPIFNVTVAKSVNNEYEVQSIVDSLNTEKARLERGSSLTETVLNKGEPVHKKVSLPNYTFSTTIQGPEVIEGICNENTQGIDTEVNKIKKRLSKLVAKELIGTIKVN